MAWIAGDQATGDSIVGFGPAAVDRLSIRWLDLETGALTPPVTLDLLAAGH